jgi:archaellum component FlaG (FlaF/FlaG flagellin family)
VVAIASVSAAMLPAINRAGHSLVASADGADDRLSSRIEIIHATGQDAATQSEAWVKNTGTTTITAVTKSDVFFGMETNFVRIPYGGASCSAPCWEYTLENDTDWGPTATLHITIYVTAALATGNTYYVKIVAPNGVEDSKFFTL